METLQNAIYSLDWLIFSGVQKLHCDFLDVLMPFVTMLGNAGIFWIMLTILLLCFPKTRQCGTAMAIMLILTLILGNLVLKPLIARPRPFMLRPELTLLISAPTDFSFPSGHTYAGIGCAVVLIYYYKKAGIAALFLALFIAFSRMYLQVHFFTDIIGGILLGTLCAFFAILLTKWFAKMKNKKPDRES
ncbi:phosphatase PAP2 family protein [Ructibacterium gallinarum]|uniref:Phosphatase PAP2 family protein n=1 Tax=Ructibacterium gallinarum TaxID=2779355 RepID=A0A9D5LZH7_9FIRM|nr:phosphatase PAP2 family protein [Ructibacterium gallinarum]MBE5039366.1 phosphatase PAP2 family protein [Ructibacterium gallinarum]